MKTHLLLPCLLGATLALSAQSLTMEPEAPRPGKPILIRLPADTAAPPHLTAYLLTGEEPEARSIQLVREGSEWSGVLTTTKATRAIWIWQPGEGREGRGYPVPLCRPNGRPVAGAMGDLAGMYHTYVHLFGLPPDPERIMACLWEEFHRYPASKKEAAFFRLYAQAARRTGDETALREVRQRIETLAGQRRPSEASLQLAYDLARTTGAVEAAERLKTQIIERYPEGKLRRDELAQAFYRERDPAAQEELFQQYRALATKEDAATLAYFAAEIARGYGLSDPQKFEAYEPLVSDPRTKANLYYGLARQLSGGSLDISTREPERALQLARRSLQLIDDARTDPQFRPRYLTTAQWQTQLRQEQATYADTYALLLYESGRYSEALHCQQQYVDTYGYVDAAATERYCRYVEQAQGAAAAEALLAQLIRNNQASDSLKVRYRVILSDQLPADAVQQRLAELEERARENRINALRKKMTDQPAATFRLHTLKGRPVALSDLQGKVVVLDFWATWCAPCRASFPMMQQLIQEYREEAVVFLFIDTWEDSEDPNERVAAFLQDYGYDFTVLLDDAKGVADAYGVTGLPTKVIIDEQGRIRFRSLGYGGHSEDLLDELRLMIELAGEAN